MSVILLSMSIFWAQVRLLETRMYDDLRIEDTSNNQELFLLHVCMGRTSCACVEPMLW